MRERDAISSDLFDSSGRFIRRCGHRYCSADFLRARWGFSLKLGKDRAQIRFRIDQELARGDDLLTFVQPAQDFRHIIKANAQLNLNRLKPSRLVLYNDHRPLARCYYSLKGDKQARN